MAEKKEIKPGVEIAHVLFIDIVGYSRLLITEQSESLRTLRHLVQSTAQYQEAERAGKLLRVPAGDGMALVFRTSLEAPADCALELAAKLKAHPEVPVRMGVHSGPVDEVEDVSGRQNVTGAGINVAQRVMDCGDAGHILLSQHVADVLDQFPRWRPLLHELGECEVKHGLKVRAANLYTSEVGNPARPQKFSSAESTPSTLPPKRSPSFARIIVAGVILVCLRAPVVIFAPAILKQMRGAKSNSSVASQDQSAPVAVAEKSIAVLPFENLSSDKENAYFADGVQG